MAVLGFRLELRRWKMFAVAAVAISFGGAVTAAQPDPASAAVTATASAQTTAIATSDTSATTDTTTDQTTTEPQGASPAPVISALSFSGGVLTVAWEDPPARAQVTKYEYRHKTSPGGSWSRWVRLPKTARRLTLAGLAENAQHHVVIRAHARNSVGKRLSMVTVGASSVPPAPGYWFSDDDASTHEGAIEALAAAGVVRGCGDRLFCPHDPLTRGQFASLLTRTFPYLAPVGVDNNFDDDDGSVHERAINALASAGITDGCRPGRYCPHDPLTRGQFASLLTRALPGPAPPSDDHFDDDDGSVHERAINALASAGITDGCGPGRYCPHDRLTRAQAATLLARALDLEPTRPRPSPWRLEPVIDRIPPFPGFPVDLQAPAGDDRLFVATESGAVLIVADGALLPEMFLDLTHKVLTGYEEGLLGLAFHPDYATNHRFYVFYTDLDGHNQVYEYRADPENPNRADPATARHIITFAQTCRQHNGGQLQFGPDGYLYIAVGDGGCRDPNEAPGELNGQNPHNLLGTIVRIDVNNATDVNNAAPYSIPGDNPFTDGQQGLPEVWAYGLRNPWRFSFDGPNIYIADVGAEQWEEVNIADASKGGINYGWNIMEGTNCYRPLSNCDTAGLFIPQIDYPHGEGISVIGGYVYRGAAIPEMAGRYFYTDITGQWIRTFAYQDGQITQHYDWSQAVEMPFDLWSAWSFGKDGHGELYLLAEKTIYKIIPESG